MVRFIFVWFSLMLILFSCQQEAVYTPKPRAYPKVEYLEKRYQMFDESFCAFSFDYPTYARVEQDLGKKEETGSDCWFDLNFSGFNGRIHCTYYEIGESKSYEELKQDAFELADYHNKKANYIDELRINRPEQNVTGFVFAIEGPAATPIQFYLTDEENHFFRGALYFNTAVRPDSIAPIYEFIREDVLKLIESFSWGSE